MEIVEFYGPEKQWERSKLLAPSEPLLHPFLEEGDKSYADVTALFNDRTVTSQTQTQSQALSQRRTMAERGTTRTRPKH